MSVDESPYALHGKENKRLPLRRRKTFLLGWRKENIKRLNCIPEIVQFTLHIWQQK